MAAAPRRPALPAANTLPDRIKESWQMSGRVPTSPGPRAQRPAHPERPPSLFGGLPISELLILLGIVSTGIGFARGPVNGAAAIIAGVLVCTVAALEIAAREHFAGYRSHSLLLALALMVGLHTGVVVAGGGSVARSTVLLVGDLAVFLATALTLKRTFKRASPRAAQG